MIPSRTILEVLEGCGSKEQQLNQRAWMCDRTSELASVFYLTSID
ncbi:hypothetical protein [Microcoleus sp. F4-D5]